MATVRGAWSGYRAAIARDPSGVAAVRAIADRIPHTAERAAAPVSLADELSWAIERESGWNPAATNRAIGKNGKPTNATGLIQFMPATARQLGTTVDDLRRMSLSQQAPYVASFFRGGPKLAVVGDLLLRMFVPAFVGRPEDTVIFAPGSDGWERNAAYRESPDGPITVASVHAKGRPAQPIPAAPSEGIAPAPPPTIVPTTPASGAGWGVWLVILGAIGSLKK